MRPGSKIESERDVFEFDRSVLIGQVKDVQLTVRNALTEISMVAAENVFDKPLSGKTQTKGARLDRMARRLDDLGTGLARAKFPRVRK